MDASTLTKLVGELSKAAAPKGADDTRSDEDFKKENTETLVKLLTRIKKEVQPTEELLKASKAGVVINRLKTYTDSQVVALAKDIVKSWKEKIEENKKKRKRAADESGGSGSGQVKKEEEGKDAKRVKAEASSASPAPSPADSKPKSKIEDGSDDVKAESPPSRPPLSTIDSSRTVPRTAKADGLAGSLKASPDDGDDQRSKCVVLLYDALAGDSTADKKILIERAQGIERSVWELFNGSTSNDYRQKMRSLYLNLKDKQNPALRNEIVLGYISTEKVANMSKEEMASESVRALNEKLASENLFKAKAVGETQAETDAFKCGRCQQRKCTYYQMQTRSADEPMTTFVTCTNCGNRWKFS